LIQSKIPSVPLFLLVVFKYPIRFDLIFNFKFKIGTRGSGDTQFHGAFGVAVDDDNNIIVSDHVNDCVKVFNSNKDCILKLGPDNGLIRLPRGVAFHNGNFVVVDYGNHRIQFFDRAGTFLSNKTIGRSKGSRDAEFQDPNFICFGPNGNYYVTDYGNRRVQVFDSTGSFLKVFEVVGPGRPMGMAISRDGLLFISDHTTYGIQVFDAEGVFIRRFGEGRLSDPVGLDVDVDGNCVVADWGNHRIQIFNSKGEFVTTFGSNGTGDQQFCNPMDVAITKSGDIIVADYGGDCIKVFGRGDDNKGWI